MADIARLASSEVTIVDRKAACLAQSQACREQAEADPVNRDYWIDEAIKWLERAVTPAGPVVVTLDAPAASGLAGQSPISAPEES